MLRLIETVVVGLAAVAILGCGTQKRLNTLSVSGKVTLDGVPVEGATVSFAPTGEGGRAASGTTDASGRYQLTTLVANDGALPGSYLVTISKTEVHSPVTDAVKPGMSKEEAMKAYYEALAKTGKKAATKVTDQLPAKYKIATTSGLKADVGAGKTEFDFELQSK